MDKAALKRRLADARVWLLDRWADFRAESPYFQAKVGLVAGYLVIVVLTLVLAPPSGPSWSIQEERLSFGLSFKTAVQITNFDNGTLKNVVVEVRGVGIEYDGRQVPGVWRTKPLTLKEGVRTAVLTEHLFDERGVSPPMSLNVHLVTIYDDDNDKILERTPTPSGARK
jgi:hypothetical protein